MTTTNPDEIRALADRLTTLTGLDYAGHVTTTQLRIGRDTLATIVEKIDNPAQRLADAVALDLYAVETAARGPKFYTGCAYTEQEANDQHAAALARLELDAAHRGQDVPPAEIFRTWLLEIPGAVFYTTPGDQFRAAHLTLAGNGPTITATRHDYDGAAIEITAYTGHHHGLARIYCEHFAQYLDTQARHDWHNNRR